MAFKRSKPWTNVYCMMRMFEVSGEQRCGCISRDGNLHVRHSSELAVQLWQVEGELHQVTTQRIELLQISAEDVPLGDVKVTKMCDKQRLYKVGVQNKKPPRKRKPKPSEAFKKLSDAVRKATVPGGAPPGGPPDVDSEHSDSSSNAESNSGLDHSDSSEPEVVGTTRNAPGPAPPGTLRSLAWYVTRTNRTCMCSGCKGDHRAIPFSYHAGKSQVDWLLEKISFECRLYGTAAECEGLGEI